MKIASQRVHTATRFIATMSGAAAAATDTALTMTMTMTPFTPPLAHTTTATATLAHSVSFVPSTRPTLSVSISSRHPATRLSPPHFHFCTLHSPSASRSSLLRTTKLTTSTSVIPTPPPATSSFASLSSSSSTPTMASPSSFPIFSRLLQPDASPAEEETDVEESDTNSEADQDLPNQLPHNDNHQQRTHDVGSEEEMMMQVPTTADILRTKQKFGNSLHSVYENDTVQVATEMMNLFGIGAVAVKNQREQIIGVMSSRDYMLAVGCGNAHPKSSLVKEMMRHQASCVYEDDSLVTALYEMVVAPTKCRWIIVRRRPPTSRAATSTATVPTSTASVASSRSSARSSELVLNSDEVLGLLSMSDVLRFLTGNLHETSSHLRHFIQNTYSFTTPSTNSLATSTLSPTPVTSSTHTINELFERFRPARHTF